MLPLISSVEVPVKPVPMILIGCCDADVVSVEGETELITGAVETPPVDKLNWTVEIEDDCNW